MSNRVITKSLAAQQDLLFGEGLQEQKRAGGNFVVDKIRTIYPVNSLDELNALDPEQFPKARLYTEDGTVDYVYSEGEYVAVSDSALTLQVTEAKTAAGTILSDGSSVQEFSETTSTEIANIKEKFDFVKAQPVVPPSTDSTKLIMRPSGEAGFWVVSRRARNRGGYIMTLVRDDVAAADSNNVGGASVNRPSVVNNCTAVYLANSVASSKSANVSFPTLSSSYVNSVWRYREDGANFSYFSESEDTSESNLENRRLYNVESGSGTEYVEFLTRGDSTLHLGTSTGSSTNVEIQVLDDTGAITSSVDNISLRQSGSSLPSLSKIVTIKTPLANRYGFYKVRVVNKSVNVNEACYVAGLNIILLDEATPTTYATNAKALRSTAAPKYRNSSGANEFAARESGGKFFGTFHGGHDQFFERLRTDNNTNYDLQNSAVPNLLVTQHCTLYSKSRLRPDSGVASYLYLLTVRFADGLDMSTQTIYVDSGTAATCSDVYTHMCTTDTVFDYVYQPVYLTALTETNTPVGDSQQIEQYNAAGLTLACYYTRVDVASNSFSGAYIQDSGNFHKQYYGPIVGTSAKFAGGTFTTIKEYF